MLSPEILAECFRYDRSTAYIPGYLAYSRTSGIFQKICHPPGNQAYSRKYAIFQEIRHIPGNKAYSRKSGIFQDIKNIPGNQEFSRKSGNAVMNFLQMCFECPGPSEQFSTIWTYMPLFFVYSVI